MKALILAGGKKDVNFVDCDNKALLQIKGKFMLQYIIDALKKSKYIDGLVIIGDAELLKDKIKIDSERDVFFFFFEIMIDYES